MNLQDCQQNNSNPVNLLEFGFRKNEQRIHEAQKPLDLFEFLIKLTTCENQIILDPFMGSGTAAIAAVSLNRNYIGFEINQDFCQIANERLNKIINIKEKQYVANTLLF